MYQPVAKIYLAIMSIHQGKHSSRLSGVFALMNGHQTNTPSDNLEDMLALMNVCMAIIITLQKLMS